MGMEYSVRFADANWYAQHRSLIVKQIQNLPSYVKHAQDDEFWLKDAGPGTWSFDVRVFVNTDRLLVEVSSFSAAFHRDTAALLHWIQRQTPAELVDDDGEVVSK